MIAIPMAILALRPVPAALLLLFSTGAAAQEQCLSRILTERWMQEQGEHTDLADAAAQWAADAARGGGIQTIPVAVHVVWNTSAEDVSDGVILDVIDQMNADYQAANTDYDDVRPPFLASRGDAQIEFCLATVDPDGNSTTGITRTNTSQAWFNPDTETNDMKSAPDGIAPWDPVHYLNIWICDLSSGAGGGLVTTGYAYLPLAGMVGSPIDGLVLDYDYGTGPGARTATHEVGHYLGLDHPWGNNNCSPGDGISDTPATDGPTFSCGNPNLMNCSVLTQYENFMDYSDCPVMFTNGQADVMDGVLNGVRSALLNGQGCGTATPGPCIPTALVGTSDGDYIDGVSLGSINNTGSGSTSGPTYHDYTASWSTSLSAGGAYAIDITGGTYSPDRYAAWIDYNGDNLFSASEKLGEFTSDGAMQTETIAFTVPGNAASGTRVLRVRGVYVNTGEPDPVDPCFNYAYGETEDYAVVIGSGNGYCMPTSAIGTADGDYIDNVVLGTLANLGSGPGDPAYSDYTFLSVGLVRGQSYQVELTSGSYEQDYLAAWIDFNGNEGFESDEMLGSVLTSTPAQLVGFPFTVPNNAALGNTRLRVRCMYPDLNNGEPDGPDPCFDFTWGETEDYGIDISTGSGIPESQTGSDVVLRTWADHVAVSWGSLATRQEVRLLDASGRTLLHQAVQGQQADLPTVALAAGVYHVLLDLDGRRTALRFAVPVP
jgi:hypothetical protein